MGVAQPQQRTKDKGYAEIERVIKAGDGAQVRTFRNCCSPVLRYIQQAAQVRSS